MEKVSISFHIFVYMDVCAYLHIYIYTYMCVCTHSFMFNISTYGIYGEEWKVYLKCIYACERFCTCIAHIYRCHLTHTVGWCTSSFYILVQAPNSTIDGLIITESDHLWIALFLEKMLKVPEDWETEWFARLGGAAAKDTNTRGPKWNKVRHR
jgi:hypothetical protein